jgi:hypothetical protein
MRDAALTRWLGWFIDHQVGDAAAQRAHAYVRAT